MGMMIIRHKVRDYGHWRPIFDAHAEMQKAAGLPTHASSTQLIAIKAKSWWSLRRRTPRRPKLLLLRPISRKR